MHPQVEKLLRLPQFTQRTPAWFKARENRLTASDIAAALDIPPFESYMGSPRADLLARKRNPEKHVFLGNEATAWGVQHEPEAIALYEKLTGNKVLEFGLMIHPELDWLGASPDGITTNGICLEVKAPMTRQIIPGHVPHHYISQVHTQLQVLGLQVAHFVQFKPLSLTWPKPAILDITVVERDDGWWARALPQLISFREELLQSNFPELQHKAHEAQDRLSTVLDVKEVVKKKERKPRVVKPKPKPVCTIPEDDLSSMQIIREPAHLMC